MPITSTYDFTDESHTVTIVVPFKGSTYDVYLSDVYLKINQPPYLLALDLFGEVDVGSAEVRVDYDTRLIHCVLRKAVLAPWPSAFFTAESPQALQERREASQARKAALDEAARERIKDAKRARAQAEVRSQMEVDRRKREALEAAQAEEKSRAQAAVFETFKALTLEAEAASAAAAMAHKGGAGEAAVQKLHPHQPSSQAPPAAAAAEPAPPQAAQKGAAGTTAKPAMLAAVAREVEDDLLPPLPPPRTFPRLLLKQQQQQQQQQRAPAPATATLPIAFTPRVFPSPLRESRRGEEEDWLARNYAKIKEQHDAGQPSGNFTFVEKSPAWLRSKAEDFVRAGDWDSAANAFSSALAALVPPAAGVAAAAAAAAGGGEAAAAAVAGLYLNRAACHLHRCRGAQCAEDAGVALEVLLGPGGGARCTPERLPALLEALAGEGAAEGGGGGGRSGAAGGAAAQLRLQCLKALSRRMVGRCLVGKFMGAAEDAAAAQRLLAAAAGAGGEEAAYFEHCLQRLQPFCCAEGAKVAGDACSRGGDEPGALQHYAAALSALEGAGEGFYALAALNRSALHFKGGRWRLCAEDCAAVLGALGQGGGGGAALEAAPWCATLEDPIRPCPPLGSELARAICVRAASRREEALRKLGAGEGEGEGGGKA
jgi:dyslexia susceptibility 1 candidate gene 1 protein